MTTESVCTSLDVDVEFVHKVNKNKRIKYGAFNALISSFLSGIHCGESECTSLYIHPQWITKEVNGEKNGEIEALNTHNKKVANNVHSRSANSADSDIDYRIHIQYNEGRDKGMW